MTKFILGAFLAMKSFVGLGFLFQRLALFCVHVDYKLGEVQQNIVSNFVSFVA